MGISNKWTQKSIEKYKNSNNEYLNDVTNYIINQKTMTEKPVHYNTKLTKNKISPVVLKNLQLKYNDCINDYIKLFETKEDMEFMGWIGKQIGGVAWFNDFTFNFLDVIYSIDNDTPKGMIVDWYYDCVDYNINKKTQNHFYINLPSYHKGQRYENLKRYEKPKT